jgi:L-2-hydroxyglutarate oxidase LhgO
VPDPRYPFLGVHFTRRVDGAVDVGPNAVLALGRQAYGWRHTHGRPAGRYVEGHWIVEAARSRAVRNMARANWRAGVHELTGSLSKRVFVARAARLVPGLTTADVVPGPAGVRAQAVDGDGTLVDDFRIHRVGTEGRIVAVRNAPSPAATSSLAIAEHVCDQLV